MRLSSNININSNIDINNDNFIIAFIRNGMSCSGANANENATANATANGNANANATAVFGSFLFCFLCCLISDKKYIIYVSISINMYINANMS